MYCLLVRDRQHARNVCPQCSLGVYLEDLMIDPNDAAETIYHLHNSSP